MKNKINHFLLCFVMIVLGSCKPSPRENELQYIKQQVSKFNPDSRKKWVIILPGLGCKGCIQEGEQFLKDHVDNDSILFVITKVESIKLLQQKTGVSFKKHSNIFLDKSNAFSLPSKNSIYPLIIQMEQQEVKDYQFQSPENSMAFALLGDRIE